MPFENFEALKDKAGILDFFGKYFPDAIPLIGEENLVESVLQNPVGPLMTIKVSTH
jgi:kynurenine 3-monooxygenase